MMSKEHQDARPTLCVGILTLNEARNISRCIKSAQFADQILVIDSGSTDETCEIAKELGAEVHVYSDWKGFGEQRNRILKHCTTDFIFFLDADEAITPNLQKEIVEAVNSDDDVIYEILWDQVAFGRTLKYMDSSGGLQRFFKTNSIDHYEGVVHEGAIMKGGSRPVLQFKNKVLHYSRETINGSLLKLAQYSHLGAVKRSKKNKTGGIWRGFFSGLAIFIRLYIIRRGFMGGAQGFLFCFFIALECFFRYVALKYDKDSMDILVKR